MSRRYRFPALTFLILLALVVGRARGDVPFQAIEEEKTEPAELRPPSAAPADEKEKPLYFCKIEASLDPSEWKIEGRQELTFLNRSAQPVTGLVFHLGLNAYAREENLIEQGVLSPCGLPAGEAPALLGYLDILNVSMAGEPPVEIPAAIQGTRMEVVLSEPLLPGNETSLLISFTAKLPSRRYCPEGVLGRHVDALDWYPKPIAMPAETDSPEEPGRAPFLSPGDYSVFLTLPEDFHVEASGLLKSSRVDNSMRTLHYTADQVRGFAWTADPNYEPESSRYRDVEIVILGLPHGSDKSASLMETARYCLDYAAKSLAPFPHERLIVAMAPYGARGSWGCAMLLSLSLDFPLHTGFFRERTLDPDSEMIRVWADLCCLDLLGLRTPESAWQGEGLSAYTEMKILAERFKVMPSPHPLISLEKQVFRQVVQRGFGWYPENGESHDGEKRFFRALNCPARLNITTLIGYPFSPFLDQSTPSLLGYFWGDVLEPGWWQGRLANYRADFLDSRDRPGRVGSKAARFLACLQTLENLLEPEKLQQAIRRFATAAIDSSTEPDTLLSVLLDEAGPAETALIEEFLLNGGRLDYAVERITCSRMSGNPGYAVQSTLSERTGEQYREGMDFSAIEEGICKNPLLRFGGPSPGQAGASPGDETLPPYRWEAEIANRGDFAMPVRVLLCFENTRQMERQWDGRGGSLRIAGQTPEALLRVAVDPEEVLVIDDNRLNNFRTSDFDAEEALFLSGWVQFWIQNYLNGWAFFN